MLKEDDRAKDYFSKARAIDPEQTKKIVDAYVMPMLPTAAEGLKLLICTIRSNGNSADWISGKEY